MVFINQLREKIGVMFGNPETTTGGRALKFYASVRMDIRRIASIKDGDVVVGGRTRVKVVKNKVAPPFRQAEFDILYTEGISFRGELIDLGVVHKLVTKSGGNKFSGSAYYYIQNEVLNANDYFYNRDGIDKPKARRHEGGFTVGGPVIADKLFFFGGYQYTKADTGFVPTASSMTVLPEALGLIQGDRTPANLVAAFKQLNPAFPLTEAQISPTTIRLLNLRNPVTGGYFVPAPRPGGARVGLDTTVAPWTGGNPLIRQRNVQPAQFEQNQFTTRLDGQLSEANRLSGVFLTSAAMPRASTLQTISTTMKTHANAAP
jgi:hypothetical protein